jgi:hypothetical protein
VVYVDDGGRKQFSALQLPSVELHV